MKQIGKILVYLGIDLVAVAVGFFVIWLINPHYSGPITWYYLTGIVAGFIVWFGLHILQDVITKK